MHRLRHLRAAVALAVLAPAVLVFLDFGRLLPAPVGPAVARLQLVPAIVRLPALGAIVTLVLILAATLVAGRVYCSTLCPLGTLQDLVIRLGDRWARRRRFRFRALPPRRLAHAAIAAAAFALAVAGSQLVLGLLEPYSAFGRILASAVRPALAEAVNGLSRALAAEHVYALQPVVRPGFAWDALAVALGSLAAIAALALWRGRLFCNLLCPAGAVLRLAARRTVLRIGIDEARCNACGVCEKGCKAGCIDAARRRVDFDACVGCFDCLDVCPHGAVRFGRFPPAGGRRVDPALRPDVDPGRRAVLRTAALAPAALLVPAAVRAGAADPRDARAPVTPPGSLARDHFTARCTACHLCVAACPTQVLRPALLAYGAAGLLQPRLVFDRGACVYDCRRCAEVCPTGAIHLLPLPEKRLVQVGRARFVKADCVVETKKKACGACAEHCPTKAIAMVPYPGGDPHLRIPEVNEEACIGCGACEHPCPTLPRKAIWVEARSPHGVAKKLAREKLEAPAAEADFPF
ncbi:MAG TPA: 4Fe-4S dicluster domain-containing protein [Anaeromyxobacter sp.]|nr:4Fe-4S dicluster domain-containing protein [Anaeromyxobacter sp.]